MARSDPRRSDYCATRHLLRHLSRREQLRRNPLASDAFVAVTDDTAMQTVARRVSAALRAMDELEGSDARRRPRHTAILVRIDLQRHALEQVASDLGLSMRQFHRERRVAHDRFLKAYRCVHAGSVICVKDVPFGEHVIARAVSLADSGETVSAASILDDVAAKSGDPIERCAALVHRGEIDAWSHRFERAQSRLDDAHGILATVSLSDERRGALLDATAALELLLAWFRLGPAAVRCITPRERRGERQGTRETLVRAAAALRNGEAVEASKLLSRLRAPHETALAPPIAIDYLTLQAELADFLGDDDLRSEHLFGRAATIARKSGLSGRALYAGHQLALTRWMHSRRASDRIAYRSLVNRIDPALPPRLRSYLIFSAADVELAIGSPQRALLASRAAAAVSTNRYEDFSARGLAAGALFRMGDLTAATSQAAVAADAARAEGHARVLSLAQRIRAQALLAQGNRRAALTAIEESVECAKRFSSLHVLAQARAVLKQAMIG